MIVARLYITNIIVYALRVTDHKAFKNYILVYRLSPVNIKCIAILYYIFEDVFLLHQEQACQENLFLVLWTMQCYKL